MEIIAYNRCDNITVRFEDDTVLEGARYSEFKDGYLKHPADRWKPKKSVLRAYDDFAGMTIVAYHGLRKCIVASDETGATSREGVFAGGDAVTTGGRSPITSKGDDHGRKTDLSSGHDKGGQYGASGFLLPEPLSAQGNGD